MDSKLNDLDETLNAVLSMVNAMSMPDVALEVVKALQIVDSIRELQATAAN